jgi:hypothetical protein
VRGPGHPLLKGLPRFNVRGPAEKLFEEAYDWARPMTDTECTRRHLVGMDVNMAFAAGANGLTVGLGAPTHVEKPEFDAKLPGSWLVDLPHVDLPKVKVAPDLNLARYIKDGTVTRPAGGGAPHGHRALGIRSLRPLPEQPALQPALWGLVAVSPGE